jgi:acyl-CoA synthetase (AMP-forming)/AMP-acid ligase II
LGQALHQPTALAICVPGAAQPYMSYGRLASILDNVAHHARCAGLKRGDTVAVSVGDAVLDLVLTLGLMRIGVVTISPGALAMPREIPIDAILTDSARGTDAARSVAVDPGWTTGGGPPPDDADHDERDRIARIVLTSGTTGDPKGVALSHDMIARRVAAFNFAFGSRMAQCSRLFVDVGISSNYGFQWIVWVLSRGGAVFLRGSDAAETLQAFELYKVQAMVASPSGLAEFVKLYEQSPAFACPFEVIAAGGGLTWPVLADRVRQRMCSHLVTSYGASEISPVAIAPYHRISATTGAVGHVCAGVRVQAVDETDRPLGPGATGIIRIRGDVGVSGYIGNPSGSERVFRNGWFYPGDIGSVSTDRVLVISGRQTVVLNIGGNKIGPEAVEQIVLGFSGVEQAAVFSVENELGIAEVWAAIVAPGDLDEGGLHRHCRMQLSHEFVPRRFLRVPALPRNVNGKLDRRRLSDLAAPVHNPPRNPGFSEAGGL